MLSRDELSNWRAAERSGDWRAPADEGALPRTDAGNGEHFARRYANEVRYDYRRGRWLVWANHWWRDDDRGRVRRLAKEVARERYLEAVDITDPDERTREAKFAIGSENRGRAEAMLLAAQSEPPIADAGDRWNEDRFLLGVGNGVVDLRSGDLRAGLPEDRITLRTPVTLDLGAACPRWNRFLDEIFGGDTELIEYIGRAIGYSLTGDVSEQCVFWCWGAGANGKTVLLTILRELAGDYAANTPFATFELRDRATIPNDLAALVGRRLVTAAETRDGVRLNEARLKAMSGGDPLTARFLYRELFTFEPVSKIWLAFNHKPRVGDDSYGFWRRVRLIPFGHQFDDDRDEHLVEKLRAELPAILAWAVRQALSWQAHGLVPPAAVASATAAFRLESDPLAEFLVEKCLTGPGATAKAAALYHAYRAWALDEGVGKDDMLTGTAFGRRLGAKFEKKPSKQGNVYLGIGLLSEPGLTL